MTVPVCRRGHCGPRRWWGDDLSLLTSRSPESLSLSCSCQDCVYKCPLTGVFQTWPHIYSEWLWNVCDGADVYTALDSRKKCTTPSKMFHLIIYILLYDSLETPAWEKLHKSHQMNCVVCQNQNGIFTPAHLIVLWLKIYSLWGRCYHVGCGMARKANLVEKLAGVSHLIEINTKPL